MASAAPLPTPRSKSPLLLPPAPPRPVTTVWLQLVPGLPHPLLRGGLARPPAPLSPVPPEGSGQELQTQQAAGNRGRHQAAAGRGGRALAPGGLSEAPRERRAADGIFKAWESH